MGQRFPLCPVVRHRLGLSFGVSAGKTPGAISRGSIWSRIAIEPLRTEIRSDRRGVQHLALWHSQGSFPVYRTYVDGTGLNETDERYIHWAIAQAIKNERELDKSVFDFLEKLLTGKLAQEGTSDFHRRLALRRAMKAQQLSGPVMAKGLEDTALYRYNRFIASHEVGSSPDQFAVSVSAFHKENHHRAQKWPHTMLATSTHDVKRGEDARARLAALSLVPEEWAAKVAMCSRILRARRADVEGTAPPIPNDEYLFFQNLIATWPAELTLPQSLELGQLEKYSERLQAAMIKSLREACRRSNWMSPDATHENAVAEYVRDALNPEVGQTFLENFLPFQQRIAEMGVHNSLVQVLLKVTSPGVADFYQGSELWDLNLPDPDNRRAVDFGARWQLLPELQGTVQEDRRAWFCKLLRNWHDAGIKLAVVQRLLQFRGDAFELFEKGSYEPVHIASDCPLRVCAFRRTFERQVCIVVASLDARQKAVDYAGKAIGIGTETPISRWRDVLTGAMITATDTFVDLACVFSTLPVALLVPESGTASE
jgi:(1->4)-alpha-D-glucan 1-alpha-D-glucosylmutase